MPDMSILPHWCWFFKNVISFPKSFYLCFPLIMKYHPRRQHLTCVRLLLDGTSMLQSLQTCKTIYCEWVLEWCGIIIRLKSSHHCVLSSPVTCQSWAPETFITNLQRTTAELVLNWAPPISESIGESSLTRKDKAQTTQNKQGLIRTRGPWWINTDLKTG